MYLSYIITLSNNAKLTHIFQINYWFYIKYINNQ